MFLMKSILAIAVSFSLAAQNGQSPKPNHQPNAAVLVDFVNSFSSLQELLNAYQAIGLLPAEDTQQILRFLLEQKVDLQAPLRKIKFSNGEYQVGEVAWKYTEGIGYQTHRGKIISIEKTRFGYELFRKGFSAFNESESANRWNLFVPKAQAGRPLTPNELALADATFMLEVAERGAYGAAQILTAGFYYLIGGATEAVAWPYRKFFAEGRVECYGDKFVVTKGFSAKVKSAAEDMGVEKSCAEEHKDHKWSSNGPKDSVCLFITKADIYQFQTFVKNADKFYVNEKKVAKILNSSSAPACNEERAKTVQEALKIEQSSLFQIPNQKAGAASSKGSSPTGAR